MPNYRALELRARRRVKDFLQVINGWLANHAGPWGGRVVAVIAVVIGYGLVWFVLGLWRQYFVHLSRPPEGRSRIGVAFSGLLVCGLATAALAWIFIGVAQAFPDWLGL
jgi:hypothetical protein